MVMTSTQHSPKKEYYNGKLCLGYRRMVWLQCCHLETVAFRHTELLGLCYVMQYTSNEKTNLNI